MYKVLIKKKVLKEVKKIPVRVQEKLAVLVDDLIEKGPVQSGCRNYSKLEKNKYHCHLDRKWVACW